MTHTRTIQKTLTNYSMTFAAIALFGLASPAQAQEKVVDILPQTTQSQEKQATEIKEETHPILRLTPDKSELIRLDSDANSVIVGNALHVNVIADSARTLVVVPRAPGATHFTVLDNKGQVIMQRHVIVASPKTDYVRIKRTCTEDADSCQNTSVFYCPDMCHEIGLATEQDSTSQNENSDADNNANNTSSNNNDDNEGSE
ncbi:MAG: pilus assembly protein N-terminal domain-containing protein [Alphaproteobacteria bacterium]